MRDEPRSGRWALAEIVLIFAVFAIQGAWPVPDVNETHYLGKVIHYWNPDWLAGDFFLDSTDTHKVFCLTFGWLSLWLSPPALVWAGRILTWLLLAWSWRRLSVAVVPRPWCSVLAAALFVCLMERCHMAGEWVVGGLEAKGFAYVFVLLGLERLVHNRWNWALVMFGAASAFHVLVGGWAAVATGVAWLMKPRSADSPPLRSLWPGILGGLLLALPGLIPSLTLDWSVNPSTLALARQIYVFERLPHHLVLSGMRPEFIVRLALLWVLWLLLPWAWPGDQTVRRLRAFVTGAVVISLCGAAIHALMPVDRALAAGLLRYYWFRLTDVALPLGVALEGVAIVVGLRAGSSTSEAGGHPTSVSRWRTIAAPLGNRRAWLALAIVVAAFHIGDRMIDRIAPQPPRSHQIPDYQAWRAACQWVADSGQVPPGAQFLTPRLAQSFKWYAGHSDVANWKDVPQNAENMIQWRDRIQDIYATGERPASRRWHDPLAEQGAECLQRLGAKYAADYVITRHTDPMLDLPVVYDNRTYVIYRLR